MLVCTQGHTSRLFRTTSKTRIYRSSLKSSTGMVSAQSTAEMKPSICVFGAGAVGLHLAACLERAGLGEGKLSLACRGATYEQIKSTGQLSVKDVPGDRNNVAKRFKLVDAAAIGDDFQFPDIVLSCAKAHHLPAALPVLKQLVGPKTLLVTIQNGLPFHHGHLTTHPALANRPLHGVDPSGELFGTFQKHQVVSGVAYIAAERLGPAEEKDILSTIWRKLLISACINPTNALTHGPTDALVRSKRTAALVTAMAAEVMRVGVAVGATYEDTPEQWLEVCRGRFVNAKFSMLQDVEAGRQLEVGALVTSVSDVAEEIGIECPRLEAVAALIHHYNENIVQEEV